MSEIFIIGIAVTITFLVFVSVLLIRRSNGNSTENSTALVPTQTSDLQTALFNPLQHFEFESLISRNVESEVLYKHAVEHVASTIKNSGGDISNITTQLGSYISTQGGNVVKFSVDVQEKLASGAAHLMKHKQSGMEMAIAVNKRGHKIIENASVVKGSANALKLANIAAVIVSTSHMISGYDNAKRLRVVDKNIGKLMRRHQNIMIARLESIFDLLKELMSSEGKADSRLLFDLKLQLKELQKTWFREVEGALLDIENPKVDNNVKRWFFKVSGKNKGIKNKIESEISAQEMNINLIRTAVFLEELIASQLNESKTFQDVTVPTIKKHLERIEKLYAQHASYIAKLVGADASEVQAQVAMFEMLRLSLPERNVSQVRMLTEAAAPELKTLKKAE